MQKPEHEIIIAGGGISGLSLAHFCARGGLKPLVIEKSSRLGGAFHTYRADDFWFELGAHTCYNSYANLIGLLDETGSLNKIIRPGKAGYRLLSGGKIRPLISQLDFPELFLSIPKIINEKPEGETVKSYYSKVLGKRNFERVIGPLLSAVICQKADQFPADMLFKKRPRRKGVPRKFSFHNGIQTITDTIAAEPAIRIEKGREVKEIGYDSGIFTVITADGSSFESGWIALATPPKAAAAVLQRSFPALSEKLSAIMTEKIETVGVIIKKNASKLPPIAALAASDDIFYSFVSRDTFPDPIYRAFAFHFMAGASDQGTKLDRIASVLGTGDFRYAVAARHVLPSLRPGHKNLIKEIDGLIAKTRLLLTGNYFSGLAIEDCVSRSLLEFKRLSANLQMRT